MAKTETLEICRKYLFDNPEKPLSPQMQDRLYRIRGAFTHWTEFPMKGDFEIRDFLMNDFDIGKRQAYDDISIIKMLLGSVQNAGKEWHRYTLIEMVKETYELAKEKLDARGMAMAIDKYGKYTQLHIPDVVQIPWEDIIPQLIEPTDDPTVIGLERDPDVREKSKKLFEKYSNDITGNIKSVHVEDIEFIDVSDDSKD